MTEEIINSDGSRNWQANILLDNIKRLEQVNKELIEDNLNLSKENRELKEKVKELDKMTGIFSARLCNKYRSALEEISGLASPHCTQCSQIINIINEVLQ